MKDAFGALVDALVGALAARGPETATDGARLLVAIAGPPGAGKSTVAAKLGAALDARGTPAAVVPLDGFHYDNAVLDRLGLRERKGAPGTFDAAGFAALLARIGRGEETVAIPLFDRDLDLARAGAAIVGPEHRIVLAEGNYLLVDRTPWSGLAPLFGATVWLDVEDAVLEERLTARWLHHGLSPEAARKRALGNDMPNARFVKENSAPADFVLAG